MLSNQVEDGNLGGDEVAAVEGLTLEVGSDTDMKRESCGDGHGHGLTCAGSIRFSIKLNHQGGTTTGYPHIGGCLDNNQSRV